MNRDPMLEQAARDWQRALAERLAQLPFPQLCELDDQKELKPPPQLPGFRFVVARHGPRRDRVRIEISEVVAGPSTHSVDAIVEALRARHTVWFEKHADGTTTWPPPGRE
jgi:hypothetical protein